MGCCLNGDAAPCVHFLDSLIYLLARMSLLEPTTFINEACALKLLLATPLS